MERVLRAVLLSPFVSQSLRAVFARESQEDLSTLRELSETGDVTPVLDRTFPLSGTPEAIRHQKDGHARGKVVITVS